MVKKLVSIIIPVYNGSNYVAEAVESALNQTYENVEVIVVNDGSDDNGKTREVLKRYDNRIKYIEKENGGVASALNEGIRNMSGDYFAWLSHDDIFEKTKIEKQMNAINACGDKMRISVMNYVFFDDKTKQEVATDFQNYYPIDIIENSIFLLLWGELHFSSLLFSKKHFDRVGLFNEQLKTAQDNEFLFRLLRNQRISFINDVGSYVRLHENAGTSQYRSVVQAENKKFYEWVSNMLTVEELKSIGGLEKRTKDKINGIIQSLGPYKESNVSNKEICELNLVICGAGVYGRRLNFELCSNNLRPYCFIDNDRMKNGMTIDGTRCMAMNKCSLPKDSIVIISNKFYEPLLKILNENGIKRIMKKTEIDAMILKYSDEDLKKMIKRKMDNV